jgi:23S rRNA pseudouridine2605 synthase
MSGIEGERVAKALARAGVASRREVERYIEAGRVRLNGHVLTTPAVKVAPGDILTVDGQVVADAEPTRMWRYHKPVDLVTTHKDPQGRPTVFEALPPDLPRVISVGRLDINSEGLLLLTNDGALARALELPSSGWNRTYRARAYGDTTQDKLDRLLKGVTVEGVKYGPITAKLDKVREGKRHTNVWITVTIAEGKNREVRRVLESLGLKVNRLIRLSYGPFQLGTLAVGAAEEIGPRVIREQLSAYIDPENLPPGAGGPPVALLAPTPGGEDHRDLRREGPRPAPVPRRAVTDSIPSHASSELVPEKVGPLKKKPGWAKAKPKKNPHKAVPVKAGRPEAVKATVKHYRAGPTKGATLIDRKPSLAKAGTERPSVGKPGPSGQGSSTSNSGKPSYGKPVAARPSGKPAFRPKGPGKPSGAPRR